ncbi:MAG: hypothetical protein HDT28_04800 [Clostridiales bacterium]|nr:hypothetical protein [Clostridiales bacterium]
MQVVTQAEAQQGDTLRVEIDSPGGYAEEGLKIYNYLKGLNRNVVTIAKNQCGSIASVIFMAGTERIATCNIFIHNPFLGDVRADYLTQDDLKEAYDYLDELKRKINAIYSSVSGMGKAGLQVLMDNETAISPEQAVTLGLATKTGEAEAQNKAYKPVARTSNEAVLKAINQIQKNMNKKTKWSERIKNLLSGKAKNIDLKDKDGNTISVDIPADRENQVPEVGDAAEPDGQFEMEDGSTIIIADGVITEIRHADEEHGEEHQDPNPQDIETLNARIAELQAENEQLRRAGEMAAARIEEYEAMEKQTSKTLNLKRPFVNKDKEDEKSALAKAIEERKKALQSKN